MRHHPPLRIAVLECDTPIGRTKEKYGGYGNLFKELLSNGAKLLQEKGEGEVELDITKYDVVNQEVYPELENVDAVLLTGSSMSGFFFLSHHFNTTQRAHAAAAAAEIKKGGSYMLWMKAEYLGGTFSRRT